MVNIILKIFFLSILINSLKADCAAMYVSYYQVGGAFDFTEYVFGDENCCDEYPVPLCDEERVYFEKENYADFTDPENWDIITPNVALTRANSKGIYNAYLENQYQGGVSPLGTQWGYGPRFGGSAPTTINPTVVYGIWSTWYNLINNPNGTFVISMYSNEDDAYYDFFVTGWTSGDYQSGGATWPGSQNGDGPGNGGGYSYYRTGPVDYSPEIIEITDVPDDQGGRVFVSFKRSMVDNDLHPHGIDTYTIQRLAHDSQSWVSLGSIGAIGELFYTYEATTVLDSSVHSDGLETFRVIAQNFYPELMDISKASAGYSIDNINPAVPTGLSIVQVSNGFELSWNVIDDVDFQYYKIQRSTNESFESHEVFYTIENNYMDLNVENSQSYFYRIASVDYNGNSSNYTEIVSINELGVDQNITPTVFKIYQNHPNPFNPSTNISYQLAKNSRVKITIHNTVGKLVKILVDDFQSSGLRTIKWNGKNSNNDNVSSGIYFYSIQSGEFQATKKMILLD